jgi:hypothetical protein
MKLDIHTLHVAESNCKRAQGYCTFTQCFLLFVLCASLLHIDFPLGFSMRLLGELWFTLEAGLLV